MGILQQGRLNVGPIDATHGSSGKSKMSDYISSKEPLDFAISHNSQNACLAEGHMVYTNLGLVRIDEVVAGTGDRVLVGDKMLPITDRFKVGIRPVNEVVLSNGVVFKATANHQFFVWSGDSCSLGWVAVGDLNHEVHQFVFPKSFPDLAEGVNIDFETVEQVHVGVPAKIREFTKVDKAIMRSSKRTIASYVAAVTDTHGNIYGAGSDGKVVISSSSHRGYLEDLQVLCTYLGLRTKLRVMPGTSKKPLHELIVTSYESVKKFRETVPVAVVASKLDDLIESKSTKHGQKYESRIIIGDRTFNDTTLRHKDDANSGLFNNYYFVDVDRVVPAGECEVYDITVDEEHAYTCNGTLSHNSHITVFDDGSQYKFNFLPSSVAKAGTKVVIGADAVINVEKAMEEIRDWDLNRSNLFIHPLVAIIEPDDVKWEMEHLAYMGSTMTGGGKAKADKVTRTKRLFAKDHPELRKYVANTHDLVNGWLGLGKTGLLETAQGYDLSQDVIWTGLDGSVKTMYPYNTSRNINTSSFLGFSFVPPQLVGSVILNIRSYAIRVGDSSTVDGDFVVKMADGSEKALRFSEFGTSTVPSLADLTAKYPDAIGIIKLGSSGPVYDDQDELSWEEVTSRSGSPELIKEQTSLTKRVRRVFSRSSLQIKNSTMACMPTVIALNFANYLDHTITGAQGTMSLSELGEQWPKVAEYVEWIESNQYWAGTVHAAKVRLIGTGARRSQIIEIV